MTSRFLAVIAAVTALSAPAFAQDKAPPKASKAEVEKLVTSIKNDNAKFALFCELQKVQSGYQAFADKKDDPKLDELDKKMEDLTNKLGPDFVEIGGAELDDEGEALFDNLAKACK